MGDHVAIGDVGSEIDVDGDRAVGGAAALLAEHGEGTGIMGAAGDGLARRGAEDLDAVQVLPSSLFDGRKIRLRDGHH
ncbi:hypothetical protein WMF30_41510 [Sorangium sp. So ce134]